MALEAYLVEQLRRVAETILYESDDPEVNSSRKTIKRHLEPLTEAIVEAAEAYLSNVGRENPRQRGDDDGVEYADPRDRRDGLE